MLDGMRMLNVTPEEGSNCHNKSLILWGTLYIFIFFFVKILCLQCCVGQFTHAYSIHECIVNTMQWVVWTTEFYKASTAMLECFVLCNAVIYKMIITILCQNECFFSHWTKQSKILTPKKFGCCWDNTYTVSPHNLQSFFVYVCLFWILCQ